MEILFDDDDLEPMAVAPEGEAAKKAASPAPLTSEASLFGDLEDALGLEPVFAPAPVQKTPGCASTRPLEKPAPSTSVSRPPVADPWAAARKTGPSRVVAPKGKRLQKANDIPYRDCPPAYPEEALFAPEEIPEPPKPPKAPKITRTYRPSRKPRVSVMDEDSAGDKIIRTSDRADAFTVVRDDGTVLEVDRDTCADPEVFARERERRRRQRTRWVQESAPQEWWGGEESEGSSEESFNAFAKKREKPKTQKKSLLTRAIDALSRREYSRKDLLRKLSAKLEDGETREDLEEALNRLESLGLLSDERFAEAQVRASAGRMGDYRLRRTLRQSGVSEEAIEAALETVEEPEEVRALRMWRRRWSEPPKDWKEREKMTRFLMTRGFGMSAIQKVLRGDVELPEDSF